MWVGGWEGWGVVLLPLALVGVAFGLALVCSVLGCVGVGYFDDERMLLVMHRLRVVGLVVLAVFAVAAVTVGVASAANMTLPEFVTKTSWTGSSTAGVLKASGVEIKCKSGTNSGEMEASRKLGTFDIDFKECSSEITGGKCTSEGDAEGIILTEGTWHLVLTTKSGTDVHLIWFLVKEFKTNCNGVIITTKGNVLGEITPANKLTKAYKIKVETTGSGSTLAQEYTSFENDSGELVSASLLSAAALGFHVATEKSENNTITTALDTLIIN
jgi:hypothetical protein